MVRPLVLLSNDDGHFSVGIRAMRTALLDFAEVILVAPETEQSAASHALSLHRPLRAHRHEEGIFGIDGTPADCVYVALHSGTRFLPRKPDLVVSGINRGLNLGQDAFYSGTVAAAREGALRGIHAVAVSADTKADLGRVADLAVRLSKGLLQSNRARAALLNLNVPAAWTGEVRATKLGARIYDELVDFRIDPRGREYFWVGGPGVSHDQHPGADTEAYDHGSASVTSLALDLTAIGEQPEVATLLSTI